MCDCVAVCLCLCAIVDKGNFKLNIFYYCRILPYTILQCSVGLYLLSETVEVQILSCLSDLHNHIDICTENSLQESEIEFKGISAGFAIGDWISISAQSHECPQPSMVVLKRYNK